MTMVKAFIIIVLTAFSAWEKKGRTLTIILRHHGLTTEKIIEKIRKKRVCFRKMLISNTLALFYEPVDLSPVSIEKNREKR